MDCAHSVMTSSTVAFSVVLIVDLIDADNFCASPLLMKVSGDAVFSVVAMADAPPPPMTSSLEGEASVLLVPGAECVEMVMMALNTTVERACERQCEQHSAAAQVEFTALLNEVVGFVFAEKRKL